MATEKLDIICITETWINTERRDFAGEFHLPGYVMFKRDRGRRAGGGVMVYIRDHITAVLKPIDSPFELIGIEIRGSDSVLHLFVVYRPPHSPMDQDLELYDSLSRLMQDETSVIVGDFNCIVNWDLDTAVGEGKRLLDFKQDNFLTQAVRCPTRGRNILDLVFASDDDLISDVVVGEHLGTSDHAMVFCKVWHRLVRATPQFVLRPNLRRANFNQFIQRLKDLQPQPEGTVNEMWRGFRTSFMTIQNSCIPLKRVGGNTKKNPKWFSDEIGRAIKLRKTLNSLAKACPSQENINLLTVHRRTVKRLVRRAKVAEEHRVALTCVDNPKEFYSYVNSRKPVRSQLGPLRTDQGILVTNKAEIAEEFNRYFSSVFTHEDDRVAPEPAITCESDRVLHSIHITEGEITTKIKDLNPNKAPGPDGFLPKVVKAVSEGITPHLHQIFNKSVEEGVAPEDMKQADVSPIFKKGQKEEASNFRPISLTSIPGKVLESIIKDRIVAHLEEHNLIRNSQHGFRRARSCLTNLLEFFHSMFQTFDQTKAVDVVYLDFRKAFDKVPHRRLMSKIRALGIVGRVADWIESWLTGRQQRVIVNGVSSGWAPVTSGVPQGSVLGPLLFVIYINDIDSRLVSRVSKFADDTKLGVNAADPIAIRELQRDLDKLGEWSDVWQMPFNVGKCHVLHVGYRNPKAEYTLQGNPITETNSEVDLGVVVTNDFKFSAQCIEAEKRANKILGYIKRQFRYRTTRTVLTLYRALVRPLLEYAVQFWSPCLRQDIARLERVQARATKLIPSIRHLGYDRRLERLGLFSLEKRRLRGQLIETFKILKGINDVDPSNYFVLSANPTRSHGFKVVPPRYNTEQFKHLMTVQICNVWNNLPEDIVNSDTVSSFKTNLDKVLPRL